MFRQKQDSLALPDKVFIAEYRLPKNEILKLCDILNHGLQSKKKRIFFFATKGQDFVSVSLKLPASCTVLNLAKCYANIAQPTVSVVFTWFLDNLKSSKALRFIYI